MSAQFDSLDPLLGTSDAAMVMGLSEDELLLNSNSNLPSSPTNNLTLFPNPALTPAPPADPNPRPPAPATLEDAIGKNGMNSRIAGLTGQGITIGQVELGRPPMEVPDKEQHNFLKKMGGVAWGKDPTITIKDLFPTEKIRNASVSHSTEVAGVMIADAATAANDGVVPLATLYSSAFAKEVKLEDQLAVLDNQAKAAESAQWVMDRGASIINFSFIQEPRKDFYPGGGIPQLDGKSLLPAFVDWATNVPNRLFVQAGNQKGKPEGFVPLDAYNNIVVGYTKQNNGIYNEVDGKSLTNIVGGRRKLDIVAPGDKIGPLPTYPLGGDKKATATDQFGTSLAAPLVAGLAAQLYQNAGKGNKLPPQLIKAVIMNGADKLEGKLGMSKTILDQQKKDWTQSEAFNDDEKGEIPLDDQMGVGQANGDRSIKQYNAGNKDPGNVPLIGWNVNQVLKVDANPFREYTFDKAFQKGDWVSATLAWNRTVALDDKVGANNKRRFKDEVQHLGVLP